MAKEIKKLNIGCGNRKLHGFINIDARLETQPDLVCNVTDIHEHFSDVDLIYACHVLEHLPSVPFSMSSKTWKDALESWYKSLKSGGVLRVAVPDLNAACEYCITTRDFETVRGFFYGGQENDFNFHYHGWTFDTLSSDLQKVGFKEIKIYDWRKTEHFYVDDYSQSYLPHMDKINGKLMSLNIEAVK